MLDFRDAWTLNPGNKIWNKSYLHKKMEKSLISNADIIIFASNYMQQDYITKYNAMKNKFRMIRNGFDPEILNFIEKNRKKLDKLTIMYTGSLEDCINYNNNVQTIFYFIQGIEILKNIDYELYKKLNIQIYSNELPNTKIYIKQKGLDDVISLNSRVSTYEINKVRNNADVFLVVLKNIPEAKQIATGKLYEYIAYKKPIISIAPKKSELVDIITHYNIGVNIEPDNYKQLHMIIKDIYDNYNLYIEKCEKSNAIKDFNGKLLVDNFKFIFETLIERKDRETYENRN